MNVPAKSIPCPLALAARQFADCPAIMFHNKVWTYAQLFSAVNQTLIDFKSQGVMHGTPCAIVQHNSPEYIIQLWALWRLGSLAFLINPQTPFKMINRLLLKFPCQFLIGDEVPSGENITRIKKSKINRQNLRKNVQNPLSAEIPLDQKVTAVLTSGSTGEPKIAIHTLGNHYFNALSSHQNIPLISDDRWLLSLPLWHVSGLSILFRTVTSGATVVIARKHITQALNQQKSTHVSLVSTQLYRLLKQPSVLKKLRYFKVILCGGSAISRTLIQKSKKSGLPVYLTYGLTEMSSQVATTQFPLNDQNHTHKSGLLCLLNRQNVMVNNQGGILVKGPCLFSGYWRKGRIELPINKSGWFATGDLGHLDADGHLSIKGRKDHNFISGGENINPVEIEHALLSINGVKKAIVVPYLNGEYGQRPAAFIKARKNSCLTQKKVKDILKTELPSYKIPDQFYVWPNVESEGTSLKDERLFFISLIKKRNGIDIFP